MLQYLMGYSDIGVTLNTYTHLSLEDAEDELKRLEDLQNARKELEWTQGRRRCRRGCLSRYRRIVIGWAECLTFLVDNF